MPREIITIQIGQCGNQSNPEIMQLALNSGNNSADSTESAQMEFCRSTPLTTMGSRIEKTSSSTKLMMTTTSLDPSSLI